VIAESLPSKPAWRRRSRKDHIAGFPALRIPRDQQTPGALAAWQKAEIGKWWPIIEAAGIKAE
jgi:hypothetical protein